MTIYDDSGYASEGHLTHTSSSGAGPSNYAGKTRRPITRSDMDDLFEYSTYKGKQKEIVEAAYGGADVLVVAPTGMGKRGLTIVVSPLLGRLCCVVTWHWKFIPIFNTSSDAEPCALLLLISMTVGRRLATELDNLRLKNVEVASISSQNDHAENQEICRELQEYQTRIKLLYLTPERLSNPEFKATLDAIYSNYNLNRLVEWGHDFRAEYRKIGNFRKSYPDVPIMALTATATATVQTDIIRSLKLDERHLFIALHPFNRKNLYYEVRYHSNPEDSHKMADILDFITTLHRRRGRTSSGIIYCRFRKNCDAVALYLRGKGLDARAYHRGIASATLDKTLKAWTTGEGGVDVVVATIAFGLGIDKPDVRYIIHFDLPKSFEGYYQETAREDAERVRRLVGNRSNPNRIPEEGDDGPTPTQRATGSLEALLQFGENDILCRHVAICRYFGEDVDEEDEQVVLSYCNNMCDVCKYPEKTRQRKCNLSSHQQAAANCQAQWQAAYTSNTSAPQSRQNSFNTNDGNRSRQVVGQKRPSESTNSAPKKPKVAAAPVLVTKPFQSASRLSKPFRPPAFVRTPGQSEDSSKPPFPSPPPPPPPPQVRTPEALPPRRDFAEGREPNVQHKVRSEPRPTLDLLVEDVDVDEHTELPEVDVSWDPDHSSKAPFADREEGFQALRRGLHNVLISGLVAEAYWSKLCENELDDNQRSEVVFRTAAELEFTAISLSSTLDGYKARIASIREDAKALSNLSSWDSSKSDFEDSQEIIASLRRHASSPRKGKGRSV
ncbi:hypothetical protein CVT26_015341 [Gymnopilus dilepis]|uniref:ATP-dependent DNA helicase n=1 Tax=Gymnopilus dilepis TaxID=231916 RepID=A0A409W4C6_9AGAR|nr:hypothetical protein CVT26_015341 [Gymnopilus dilepis]